MVKIRLMRIGTKGRPFYRVVAVDQRNKRSGAYIELLGTYNPLTEPHEIKLKQDRIDDWVKKGAQMSDGFLRIIGKAPQKPPRKAKKEKKVTGDREQGTEKTEEKPVEEAPVDETPAEAKKTVIPSDVEESVKDVSPEPASAGDPSATPQDDIEVKEDVK